MLLPVCGQAIRRLTSTVRHGQTSTTMGIRTCLCWSEQSWAVAVVEIFSLSIKMAHCRTKPSAGAWTTRSVEDGRRYGLTPTTTGDSMSC